MQKQDDVKQFMQKSRHSDKRALKAQLSVFCYNIVVFGLWAAFYYTVRCKRIKENLIFNHVAINYPLSLEFTSCHSNEEKIICH